MIRAPASAITVALLLTEAAAAQNWRAQPLQIPTRWTASVTPDNALREYPRPQLVRQNWQNLNGLWNYAITPIEISKPTRYDGNILVPYPLESALSGVQKSLRPDQLLWYRRTIAMESMSEGRRVLLHFGGVDYQTSVYVNSREVGTHTGGYQSFTFDITDALKPGENELVVKVLDPTDVGPNPHGKQALHPQGIRYTSSSGIWQTVWLELVPPAYIENVTTTPDLDRGQLNVQVEMQGAQEGYTVEAIAKNGSAVVSRHTVNGSATLQIKHPHLWSPDDPFLYDLQVRLLRGSEVVDEVKSYFGMRKIEVRKNNVGIEQIFLNDRYTYNLGVLDQGFWPDGLYTAPTDEALKFDIQAIKAMGFNTIRKHVKVEPDRWYYYCDKLGVLVWQDMVPPGNGTSEAHAEFEREAGENLAQLHNHPSIVTWVLFNEGWGAYNQGRLAHWIKTLDPSRLLDAHSGPNIEHMAEWERHLDPSTLSKVLSGDSEPIVRELRLGGFQEPANWTGSDMTDVHVYPDPEIPPAQAGRARVLGEHGGIGVPIEGHTWNNIAGFGYVEVTPEQMARTYKGMVRKLKLLQTLGLSGSIYTQPFDVEGEQNGLMTYDRAVIKIPVGVIDGINSEIVPKPRNYIAATRGFTANNTDLASEAQRYAKLVAQYRKGDRNLSFLRQLSMAAIQQRDQALATEAGNEFIDRLPQPYSKDAWDFIQAVTRTSRDRGFDILRAQTEDVDAAMGENAAESTIRQVIGREEIDPYTSGRDSSPDWASIEKKTRAKYGVLGAEKVYGAEMIYYLGKEDWASFSKYYMLYFETATSRSEYSISDLSYTLLRYVVDADVLEAAAKVCGSSVDLEDTRGESDPIAIDTYANLLYKLGKKQEALEWEERAEQLSQGRDQDIAGHLKKMKAGQPTWSAG